MQRGLIKILVVDDHPSNLYYLARNLEKDGFLLKLAKSMKEAVYYIKSELFDFVISEPAIKDISVLQIFNVCKKISFPPHIILMMNENDPVINSSDLSFVGYDLTAKPVRYQAILEIIENHQKQYGNPFLILAADNYSVKHIVVRSEAMNQLIGEISLFAPSKATVLIQGESGAGKEVIARLIHNMSPRKDKPFFAVNCSAITESILENELFGHEKGAYTGAAALHKGYFEIAHSGTIFLDEIGEMAMAMQVKLLRVLELREFMRVGGNKPIKTDIRIIAATNQNLEEMVENNLFRKDLFYRLKVVQITVPALRNRPGDIPFLSRIFLNQIIEENQLPPKEFSRNSFKLMQEYSWPGNIRELKNFIERLSLSTRSELITIDDVHRFLNVKNEEQDQIQIPLGYSWALIEKKIIEEHLKFANYNRTHTAKNLKIGLRTLQRKMKKYNITDPDYS